MTAATPRISVIVASHNARSSIEECLCSLLAQPSAANAEIMVVDNSTDGTAETIHTRFPDIRLIIRPASAFIPELWAAGIGESTGEIVAITTAHCVPDRNWLSEICKAHETSAAVGGAVENDRSATVVDWAIYFCRYSCYMLPFREGEAREIAGDNASYRRAHLERCRPSWRSGFWEPVVHTALRKAGVSLRLAPSIIVRHKKSFGLWSFAVQRFQHGRQFGGERAARVSRSRRALYLMLSGAIPLLFLGRITRQVLIRRKRPKEFLLSLPVLMFFLLAWTSGEFVGYLRGST